MENDYIHNINELNTNTKVVEAVFEKIWKYDPWRFESTIKHTDLADKEKQITILILL